MATRDEIAQQALALPPDDRAYVADVIEQSLTGGEFATAEIASAWAAEIERRIDAYDRGEVQALDGETAVQRIRQYLASRRAGKSEP
jgi:putative addiction module component (TIGR02574 family)